MDEGTKKLQRSQVGNCKCYDAKHQTRDNKILLAKVREDAKNASNTDMDKIEEVGDLATWG